MKEPQNQKYRYLLLALVGVTLLWYQWLGLKEKKFVSNKVNLNKTVLSKSKNHPSLQVQKTQNRQNRIASNNRVQKVSNLKSRKLKRSKVIIRNVANKIKSKVAAKTYRRKYEDYFEEQIELGVGSFQISASLVAEPIENEGQRVALFQVGNFNVYEEEIDNPLSHHEKARLLYNSSTKRYAILTGLIFIRFEKRFEVEEIEERLPVRVKETIEHLNFNVVIPNDGISIVEIEKQLKALDEVEDYEIEILEGVLHEK